MKIDEIKNILTTKASELVSREEAEYFADETIETHIRKSPRSNTLKSSIKDLKKSLEHKDKQIEIIKDLAAYYSIDFKSHGPAIYIKQIHDTLEKKSEKNGIAMVSFTNSQAMHTLHLWVQGLAKRGLVAIATNNGGPSGVIPHNGTYGVFGTNPLAYGFPGEKGDIHCIDMATSEAPYFEIMNAAGNDEKIREGIAVDTSGQITTNPKDALDYSKSKTDPVSNLVPMGNNYKGYLIVYLMEVLTSALIGQLSAPEMTTDYVAEEHGAIILVFNPNALGTSKSFEKSISALNHAIKSQQPKDGEEIFLPGENNNERYKSFTGDELSLDEDTKKLLESI